MQYIEYMGYLGYATIIEDDDTIQTPEILTTATGVPLVTATGEQLVAPVQND